jgi:phosphonate transport system substrate-binding protein
MMTDHPKLPRPHLLAKQLFALCLLPVLCLALTACQGAPTPKPTQTHPAATATRPLPTAVPPTATPPPLGSSGNPILIGVVPASQAAQPTGVGTEIPATPTVLPSQPSGTSAAEPTQPSSTPSAVPTQPSGTADQLASALSQKTGYTIQTVVFASYPQLVEALAHNQVQAAWLPPLTYLLAYQRSIAQVALVTNHYGVYAYGTWFLANADEGYSVYFDSAKNESTADAADALRQFAGKRPCWVDPTSPSGYVLPKGVLAVESVHPGAEVITQDHGAVIRALYSRGICDFGATFGIIGDPRTASAIQKDLPDVSKKVIVVWQSPAVIPNLNLSFSWSLEQSFRARLSDGLLSLAQSKEGLAAMSASTGYQVDGLKSVNNDFYNDLMFFVQASGVDPATLMGK